MIRHTPPGTVGVEFRFRRQDRNSRSQLSSMLRKVEQMRNEKQKVNSQQQAGLLAGTDVSRA